MNENSHKFGAEIKKMKLIVVLSFCFQLFSRILFAGNDTLMVAKDSITSDESALMARWCTTDSIIDYAYSFQGTPYRYSGSSPSGFDCSGFINYIHRKFGIDLARSSREIARSGEKIPLHDIEPGDLVFFTGRRISVKTVGHVGLVIEKTSGGFKMIHASVSGGVRIDEYQTPYYKQRFLLAKRLAYPSID